MSRLLIINKQKVDIDDTTAIGITLQAYDVKNPSQRKASISNTFSIPLTANNNRIFGFPASVFSNDKTIYATLTAEYWEGGYNIINNGIVRVEEVSDRINLFLVQKSNLWDALKQITWSQFSKEYIEWLAPTIEPSYSQLIANLTTAQSQLFIPSWIGQLSRKLDETGGYYIEDAANHHLNYNGINGGHMAIYCVDVFRFIEYKYGINMYTAGAIFVGNLFSDTYVQATYTPIRGLGVNAVYSGTTGLLDGFKVDYLGDIFTPLDAGDKKDKTLHDFVTSFFQVFNVIVEEGDGFVKLARWDNITDQPPIDWSKKLAIGAIKFKPSIGGYSQNNFIKFGSVFEGGSEFLNGKTVTCQNKNIEQRSDLFTIDGNVPPFIQSFGGIVPDLSDAKTFETFQFFISAFESPGVKARTTAYIAIYYNDGVTNEVALAYLEMPSVYSIANEYLLLNEILQYPEYREVSCWLTINDILNLKFYAQYYFQQLGGSYFINKIAGFNPSKSLVATKLELIKVSDQSPTTPPNVEYYVDGVGTGFTDGINDLFY